MKELPLQGQATTVLLGVSVVKEEMYIHPNLFHFPPTGSVPLLTTSEQNSHLINKGDLSRSESQRFFVEEMGCSFPTQRAVCTSRNMVPRSTTS